MFPNVVILVDYHTLWALWKPDESSCHQSSGFLPGQLKLFSVSSQRSNSQDERDGRVDACIISPFLTKLTFLRHPCSRVLTSYGRLVSSTFKPDLFSGVHIITNLAQKSIPSISFRYRCPAASKITCSFPLMYILLNHKKCDLTVNLKITLI